MFQFIKQRQICVDIESVPCAWGIRRMMRLGNVSDEEAVEAMFKELRKKEQSAEGSENSQPFPKLCFHRVVSISCLLREEQPDKTVKFSLLSFPSDKTCEKCDERQELESEKDAIVAEREVISSFFQLYGKDHSNTQTVTYNGSGYDITVLLQRAVIVGVPLGAFGRRPVQGWQEPSIYHRDNPWFIDLMKCLSMGNTGKAMPALNDVLTQLGFPGKMETSGSGVYDLWRERKAKAIRDYNDYDALSTYLLFAAMAHASGYFTLEQFKDREMKTLHSFLEAKSAENNYHHLCRFLEEWTNTRRL